MLEQTEHHAASFQAPHAGRAHEQRRIVAGVGVRERAVPTENPVEGRQKPGFDGAAKEPVVEPRDERCGARLVCRFRAEHAENGSREQGRRRSLTGDVSDDEPELARRQIDVIEKIPAHRAARDRRGGGKCG